jgi:predicted Zn-dependent protease
MADISLNQDAPSLGEERVQTPASYGSPEPARQKRTWRKWLGLSVLGLMLLILLGFGGNNWYRYLKEGHYYRAAEKARRQRDFAAARALARQSVEAWPSSARAHFLLALIARQAGLFDSAEDSLAVCERLEGPSDRIRLERTLLLVQQGQLTPSTERQLRGYVSAHHADSAEILEALARACLNTYRPGDALWYLDGWLELDPGNVQAYLWRAAMHERLMDFEEAKRDCRKAVELAPQNQDAQIRLAETLIKGLEPKEAAERFEELYRRQPTNPEIAVGLARAEILLGHFERAEQLLNELAREYPDDAPVLVERGKLELKRGQPAMAARWLRKAVELAPADYQTNYSLLQALQQSGDSDGARGVEEKLAELHKDFKRLDEVHEQLKLHPYDLDLRCEVARTYIRQGAKDEGARWLKMVVRMDPDHALANQLLAEYYEKSGQPGLAAPYREKLKAITGH